MCASLTARLVPTRVSPRKQRECVPLPKRCVSVPLAERDGAEEVMMANRFAAPLNFSLEGQLLVANPTWNNQLFGRSVCLVVHHSPQGAVGIFLNRAMNLDATVLWQQVAGSEIQKSDAEKVDAQHQKSNSPNAEAQHRSLHFGGPKSGPVVALHNRAELAEFRSADGVYLAAQLSHLEQLLKLPEQDAQLKIIVGQADWPPGLLDNQFAAGNWLPLPVLPKLVFADSPSMWAQALREVGHRFVVGITGAHGQPGDLLAN